ncbi:hypothetical protein LXL04_035303 [Taraxacum kok-saghyz]
MVVSLVVVSPKPSDPNVPASSSILTTTQVTRGIVIGAKKPMSERFQKIYSDISLPIPSSVIVITTAKGKGISLSIEEELNRNMHLGRCNFFGYIRVMRRICAELAWISRVFDELQVPKITPVPLKCDNQAAIYIAKNPVFHERTKHIEID